MQSSSSIQCGPSLLTPIFPDKVLRTRDIDAQTKENIYKRFAPLPKEPMPYHQAIPSIFLFAIPYLYAGNSRDGLENEKLSVVGTVITMIFLALSITFYFNKREEWEVKNDFKVSLSNPFVYDKVVSDLFCSYLLRSPASHTKRYLGMMSVKQILGGLKIAGQHVSKKWLISTRGKYFDPYIQKIFKQIEDLDLPDFPTITEKKQKNVYICNPYLLEATLLRKRSPQKQEVLEKLVEELAEPTEKLLNFRMVTFSFSDGGTIRVAKDYLMSQSKNIHLLMNNKSEVHFDDCPQEVFRTLTMVLEQGKSCLNLNNIESVANIAYRLGMDNVLRECLTRMLEDDRLFDKRSSCLVAGVFESLKGNAEEIAEECVKNYSVSVEGGRPAQKQFKALSNFFEFVGLPEVTAAIRNKLIEETVLLFS